MLVTAVMVAAKFVDDKKLSNKDYSKIGGFNVRDLNKLELELLSTLRYALHVERREYDAYVQAILEVPVHPH